MLVQLLLMEFEPGLLILFSIPIAVMPPAQNPWPYILLRISKHSRKMSVEEYQLTKKDEQMNQLENKINKDYNNNFYNCL